MSFFSQDVKIIKYNTGNLLEELLTEIGRYSDKDNTSNNYQRNSLTKNSNGILDELENYIVLN